MNGLHLMAIKPVKGKTVHVFGNIIVKGQLRAINGGPGRQITMVYECITELRMCSQCLDIVRKVHLMLVCPFRGPLRRDKKVAGGVKKK